MVVGVGVTPDVMLAQKAGLEIGERGGVLTDATLATQRRDVFAAGDIAEYDSVVHGRRDCASSTGTSPRTRARPPRCRCSAATSPTTPSRTSSPTCPTGRGWSTSARPTSWSEEIVRGSIDDGEFTVWYLDGDRLAAALAVDRSDDLERARELIKSREPVDREELAAT